MASAIYNQYKLKMGTIDWETAAIKVMLVTDSYGLDLDLHENRDDVVHEVSGTGYTTGGQALVAKTVTRDDANDWAVYDATDALWPNSTITARYGIVYLDSGLDSTDTLIAYVDFLTNKISDGADFIIQWHDTGVFRLG